jgi:hypothetical protein
MGSADMKWTIVIASLAAFGFAGPACSKRSDDGTTTVALEGLPDLEAQVPAETRVAKDAMGIGVMLKGPGVSMTISPSQRDVDPSNLAEAKKNAEAYSPKAMKEEQLSDGYILTYESQGSTGTNYWLVGRRKIEGISYSCGVRSPKKEHQQSAVAICKSLNK